MREAARLGRGLHTGEVELRASEVRGIAVHMAARISQMAAADQVLVSSTVKDLVAGAGLRFEGLGENTFKGIEEPVRVFLSLAPNN